MARLFAELLIHYLAPSLRDIWQQAQTDPGTAPRPKFQSGCPERLKQFVVKKRPFFYPDDLTITKNDPVRQCNLVN
jgi:hypothetical protein